MSSKRLINIYWDIVNNVHRTANGAQLRKPDYPFINYKELPLVNLYIVTDSDLTPYTDLDPTFTFTVALDNNFDHSDTLIAKTLDSGINVSGDFFGNSNLDANVANGELSVRLDANNSSYQSKIGTSEELPGVKFELLGFSADSSSLGEQSFVLRFPFRAFNILDDNGTVPPDLGDTFFKAGSISIGSGVDFVTASGLGLAFTPAQIVVTVRKPSGSGDYVIGASVRDDSITSDGFTADFTADTPNANYKLDYFAFA